MLKNCKFSILLLIAGVTFVKADPKIQTGMHSHSFTKEITRDITSQYYLYLPKNYLDKEKWPLLLYLHGNMGRGDDLKKINWYPVPKMMAVNDSLPFIIVAPLCPSTDTWTDADLLISLVDEITATYAVDTTRLYLAGYSLGGNGVWYLAYKYPDRFAAIAPMSGYGTPLWAPAYKNLPIWVFYNTNVTNNFTVASIEAMINAVKEAGGDIKVTVHPERDHRPPDSDEHMRLFEWFLAHKKSGH